MKTSTRNRLTAILATVAALAVGSFFAVSASSHKSTLAVQTNKSLTATVSSSAQPSSPVSTPVQIAETTPVATAPVASLGPVASATSVVRTGAPAPTVVKATHRVLKVTVSKGSTVATRTATGTQTVTVNTSKVKVSVNPTVSSKTSSSASTATDTTGDSWFGGDGRTLIAAAPDWNGFIAPTASFASVLSCVKSTTLEQSWFGGPPSYPYIVSEKWKLTGGNFYIYDFSIGKLRHFTPNDTYYETFSDEKIFTNNMNLTTPSDSLFEFLPFNSLPSSRWADGTADTVRNTRYVVTSIYKQSECN